MFLIRRVKIIRECDGQHRKCGGNNSIIINNMQFKLY